MFRLIVLVSDLKKKVIPGINSTYASVDDIDLYVGGLSELNVPGSNVGPTLSCLIAEHFKQIKYSDRYFYELGGQPHSFSSGKACCYYKISKHNNI